MKKIILVIATCLIACGSSAPVSKNPETQSCVAEGCTIAMNTCVEHWDPVWASTSLCREQQVFCSSKDWGNFCLTEKNKCLAKNIEECHQRTIYRAHYWLDYFTR